MEKWSFWFTILVIVLAGAFGQGCIIEEKGNELELKNCHDKVLKIVMMNPEEVKAITGIGFGNNFPKLNNEFFGKFKNMKSLNLKQCKISEISPDAFQGLTKLKKLYLTENEITRLYQHVFEPLACLQSLYLDENKIEYLDKNLLKHNRNLRVLSLGFNQISSFAAELLANLQNLEDFSIQNNQIRTFSKKVFQENKKLKSLNLMANGIFAIERDTFQHLNELTYLNLKGNECVNKKIGDSKSKINLTEITRDLGPCFKIFEDDFKSEELTITTESPVCTCPTTQSSITNGCNDDGLVFPTENDDDVDYIEILYFIIFGLVLVIIFLSLTIAIMYTRMPENRIIVPSEEMNELQEIPVTRVEPGYVEMNANRLGAGYVSNHNLAGEESQQIRSAGRVEHIYETI
jgi:hypothetical protein